MHPILSDRKKLTIYLVVWILAGFLLSALVSRWYGMSPYGSILLVVPMMAVYGEMNLSAWFIAKTFSFGKKDLSTILGVLAAVIVLVSSAWVLLCWGWTELIENIFGIALLPQKTWVELTIVYGAGIQLYLISLAVSYLMTSFEASRQAERDAFGAQVLAQAAELKALRMQINPHFLFNCLNSINALVSQNPEKAREMTTLLADFFRKSLQYGSKDTITLAEEIALLNNYLDIEKIRFGKRLQVEQNIDQSSLAVYVPPLLLQPLLENAIKHGISGTIDGGTISIRVERKQERIFITLENPLDEETQSKKGAGMGLQIVRKRMSTLFGSDGDVQTFRDASLFRTILFFPVKQ